ncbi:glycosyl hydrolase 2 galactose-binding domain-containing protein [Ramlibacter rhizophilus]|uniref:glycosyl hydrolase 2 galactose-binding domain-containing protein n=1 Tax=Ramlibacter rhizophilus TaxID=1781167 RepID=UPI0014326378|nr:glycoside hydrolase family 2 protein [Ramlibacter rhizophilus]
MRAEWHCCPTDTGAPAPSAGAGDWMPMEGGAQTAAAALRARGEWSLDGPARDFDGQDWWFRARFASPGGEAHVLGCEGLATLAEVSLNGQALFTSDNMFLAHRHPLSAPLLAEDNELLIHCRALRPELGKRRPRPRWRAPMVPDAQLRWLRTTLLGRTPGWSPPVAPVGPWREVWCRPLHEAAWSFDLRARIDDGHGVCELGFEAPEGWSSAMESAQLVLIAPDGATHTAPVVRQGQGFSARLELAQPRRWWPHTHGEPVLYEAVLQTQARGGGVERLAVGKLGFREVTVDIEGGRFALRINGEPVFCRGAGWFPLDVVSLRSQPQACHEALLRARDAGLNLLRLPGTGVYEDADFYARCDELGLMVWQEFMFASMDYPFDDPAFAASCTAEARQQLARLAGHACLVVLCGNSEVEQQAAMWGAPRAHWQPRFFHEHLPALCAELAPGLPYWPSSAHGGAFPHQADQGTTSYYGVGAYERPLADAQASRLSFATECLAFAGVPNDQALARMPGGLATRVHHPQWKARSPRDLNAGWDFDDVRDHYVATLCGVEPARLRHADHGRYLALGRLAVAHAMAHSFGEWRRPDSRCGGALLLQLRDFWAGAGWGVLDELGRAKSGWHALRRMLQPLALHLSDEGANGAFVHLVNERAEAFDGELTVSAWQGAEVPVVHAQQPLHLPARSSRSLPVAQLLDHVMDLTHFWRFGPPACDVLHARLAGRWTAPGADAAVEAATEAFLFPLGLAPLLAQRRDLGLRASLTTITDGHAMLHLQTRCLALDLHADIPGWEADDDHLHLAPGAERHVKLQRRRAGAPLAGSVGALNAHSPVFVEARA